MENPTPQERPIEKVILHVAVLAENLVARAMETTIAMPLTEQNRNWMRRKTTDMLQDLKHILPAKAAAGTHVFRFRLADGKTRTESEPKILAEVETKGTFDCQAANTENIACKLASQIRASENIPPPTNATRAGA